MYLHFYHICALRCHRQQLPWCQSPWYRQNYFSEYSSNSTWRIWKSQLKLIHVFLYPIIKTMRSAQLRACISQFDIDMINIYHKYEVIIELFDRFHGWSIPRLYTLCVWIIHLGCFLLRTEWARLYHSIETYLKLCGDLRWEKKGPFIVIFTTNDCSHKIVPNRCKYIKWIIREQTNLYPVRICVKSRIW